MKWKLVADVGGTNVRFAHAYSADRLEQIKSYELTKFSTFVLALEAYLEQISDLEDCTGSAVAAAGFGNVDEIILTNADWVIRRTDMQKRLGNAPFGLFNDLQASAFSMPGLAPEHFLTILNENKKTDAEATRIAINAGTGVGACPLVFNKGAWVSLPGEAGHMTLTASTEDEFKLVQAKDAGFVALEDVLAGSGLQRLYAHLAGLKHEDAPQSQNIFALKNDAAEKCRKIYTQLLGRVCGDLALTAGARGGVYLFGSVARGWLEHANLDDFNTAFTSKGKMTADMKDIPVHFVTLEEAPLLGLASQQYGRFS